MSNEHEHAIVQNNIDNRKRAKRQGWDNHRAKRNTYDDSPITTTALLPEPLSHYSDVVRIIQLLWTEKGVDSLIILEHGSRRDFTHFVRINDRVVVEDKTTTLKVDDGGGGITTHLCCTLARVELSRSNNLRTVERSCDYRQQFVKEYYR